MRRGLTLLEVLVATVLLSIMAATCLPTITQSLAALRHKDSVIVGCHDVAIAADAFLADPNKFGVKSFDEFLVTAARPPGAGGFEFQWKAEASSGDSLNVAVEVLRSESPDVDHAWLLFRSQDQTAMRWFKLA